VKNPQATAAWVRRMCDWLEGQAAQNRKRAETCNFESLTDAYLADARNYEAMARDGRAALDDPEPER